MTSARAVRIDELDRAIIAELKKDGRQSAQAIAEIVGVSSVTVRMRIKNLESAGLIKVVAVTDFGAAGFDVIIAVGVEVERRKPDDVARELAMFERVLAVNLTTGANDIELLVGAPDMEAVSHFLEHDIGAVQGVGRLSAAVALEVFKYQPETEAAQ